VSQQHVHSSQEAAAAAAAAAARSCDSAHSKEAVGGTATLRAAGMMKLAATKIEETNHLTVELATTTAAGGASVKTTA
jgi:hypothetical protein